MAIKDTHVSELANPLVDATDSGTLPAKPLLSVVVPAYQAEGSIGRLLDSLCAWNGSDVEIIIVNDGSTDGTHAHAAEYAARDVRIRLIDKENEGRSSARNIGVAAARGEWIMFADSDDYLLDGWPNSVRAVAESACDLVIFGVEKSTQKGTHDSCCPEAKQDSIPAANVRRAFIDGGFSDLTPASVSFGWNACWSRLYRRTCVLKASALVEGELFPEGLKFSEDRLFNLLYLDVIDGGTVLLDYAPIYYWDLGLSSTVGKLSPDDVAGLVAYKAALDNMSYHFAADDACKLMSAEAASQFRRSARLPANDLKAASLIWKHLLKAGILDGCHTYLARFMGKREWMFKPAVALLFAGKPYTALRCERFVQTVGAKLHG